MLSKVTIFSLQVIEDTKNYIDLNGPLYCSLLP